MLDFESYVYQYNVVKKCLVKKWDIVSEYPGSSLSCTNEFLWVGDRRGVVKQFSIKRRVLLKDYGDVFGSGKCRNVGKTDLNDIRRGR